MAAAQPAATLDELPSRALGRRALFPLAAAALRARSRLGAPAPGAARAESAPLGARGNGVRPSARESDRRHAKPALGAPCAARGRAASARRRRPLILYYVLSTEFRLAAGSFFLLLGRAAAYGG